MSVKDIARPNVVTAAPDTPVRDIAGVLGTENVGCVVIVEEARPVGVLTDRGIALAVGGDGDAGSLVARDLMGDDLVTVNSGTDVFDLVETMEVEGVRRIPVVDDAGNLDGIVSLDDVLVHLGREFANVAELIGKQSARN